MAKVNLERLDQKLDDVIGRLDESTKVMAKHIDEDHEMYIKVDRLVQSEGRREWHLRAIWGAISGIVVAGVTRYLH